MTLSITFGPRTEAMVMPSMRKLMEIAQAKPQATLLEARIPKLLTAPVAKLRQTGWRVVSDGRGASGVVMRHPEKDHVAKLYLNEDRAYDAFVRLAQANPNPHFPVFPGRVLDLAGFHVVRIEPLKIGNPVQIAKLAHLVDIYMHSLDDASDDPGWQNVQSARAWVEDVGPAFKHACDLIARNLLDRFNLDIDAKNNVLMRGSTYVFSDPVAIALAD